MKRTSLWQGAAYALALLSFGAPRLSVADELPEQSVYDSRIQYVDYNPGDVVVVAVRPGRAVRLVFSPNEKILDVASGFTDGWELVERGSILFLKAKSLVGDGGTTLSPQAEKWNTNLVVTTNQRLYDFDLRLVGGQDAAAYRVEFRYPQDVAKAAAVKQEEKKSQEKLSTRMAPRNWSYSMELGKKSAGIAPSLAYDDGNFTYLKFPNNREFPAAFLVGPDGSEGLVNSHVEGEVLVVHRVAPQLVLRYGKAVVTVYNEAFDRDGINPSSGTTAPGVKRELQEGK